MWKEMMGIKTNKDIVILFGNIVFSALVSVAIAIAIRDITFFPEWSFSFLSLVSFGVSVLSLSLFIMFCTFAAASLRYHSVEPSGEISSPFVSVIIPAHNEEKVIRNLVIDLLKQSYKKLEVIVVAHNCSDKTVGQLSKMGQLSKINGAFKILELRTIMSGKALPLNFALKHCTGEIIAQVDADNRVLDKDFVMKAIKYFLNEEVDAVQCRLETMNPKINFLTRFQEIEYKVWAHVFYAGRNVMNLSTPLGGTGCFIRRRVLENVGFWKNELVEDFDLYLRMMKVKAKIVYAHNVVSYDEKPMTWSGMIRQRKRWVRGHLNLIPKYLFSNLKLWDKLYLLGPLWLLGWYFVQSSIILSPFFGWNFWYLPPSIWVSTWLITIFFIYLVSKKVGCPTPRKNLLIYYFFSFNTFLLLPLILMPTSWSQTKTEHLGGLTK